MKIKKEHVKTAYRKLKRLVYYDKNDLYLRQRLANFESDPLFEKKLAKLRKVINGDHPLRDPTFIEWLKEIRFRVVPKNIDDSASYSNDRAASEGRFISNVTSAKCYHVDKVNYFFDGPIELHLIAVLWIMFEGRILDIQLGKECYGARLEDSVSKPDDRSAGLFRRYHELYAHWRDLAINKAKQLLTEEHTSVCILGLDLQEFYYHIQLNYDAIARSVYEASIEESENPEAEESPSNLLECLNAICIKYRNTIGPFLQITHGDILSSDAGIPIGLCSSPLLANWHLQNFDKAVKTIVRPAYYGRYVDDILLVIPVPEDPSKDGQPVETFMNHVLVKPGLLHKLKDERYEIAKHTGLFLKQSKCILQYFDAKHSIAGLEKFKKKLEKNASDFLLMPVDEADSSLEDVAYELLYEGSVNKFRSVKGMAENRYELAKHLARQTILHLLTNDPPDPKISFGLRKFFKGKNAIEFNDLWERVLTLLLIADNLKAAKAFTGYLLKEIKRIKYEHNSSITQHLIDNLERHLALCVEMSCALTDHDLQLAENDHTKTIYALRYANLIRHHFIKLPLLNYTTYHGSLTVRSVDNMVTVDKRFLDLSPRYVHFDECLMLANSGDVKLDKRRPFQWASDIYKTINRIEVEGIEWKSAQVSEEGFDDGGL